MIAALDVHYDESTATGTAAAVVFRQWDDMVPLAEYTVQCHDVQSYLPGEFYLRELPCLLSVLAKVREPLHMIVIDGYVRLGDQPGLGCHLWKSLDEMTPIIGVAKSRYRAADAVEVLRGGSRTPLYVTAAGMDPAAAAECIRNMAGEYRIPRLLKHADQLARGRSKRC